MFKERGREGIGWLFFMSKVGFGQVAGSFVNTIAVQFWDVYAPEGPSNERRYKLLKLSAQMTMESSAIDCSISSFKRRRCFLFLLRNYMVSWKWMWAGVREIHSEEVWRKSHFHANMENGYERTVAGGSVNDKELKICCPVFVKPPNSPRRESVQDRCVFFWEWTFEARPRNTKNLREIWVSSPIASTNQFTYLFLYCLISFSSSGADRIPTIDAKSSGVPTSAMNSSNRTPPAPTTRNTFSTCYMENAKRISIIWTWACLKSCPNKLLSFPLEEFPIAYKQC